jgi:RNA polymerase sigma factor (sigma-70 family)
VLEAARAGDRQALESLLVAHYDRVHALCRRMLGNEADALDATQDALLAAMRALERFDGRSTFSTWIYRIATNTCIDELRRRRRRPAPGRTRDIAEDGGSASGVVAGSGRGAGLGSGVGRGTGPGIGSPTGSGIEPEIGTGLWRDVWSAHPTSALWGRSPPGEGGHGDVSAAVATRVDVERALASLPVELRAAVVLRDVCDLPYDEIAAVVDVPIGTVRSRIARGRAAVAAILGAGSEEAPSSVDGTSGNRAGAVDVQTPVGDQPPGGGSGAPRSPRRTP